MAERVTIKVPRRARGRLAQVAQERGLTVGQLVEQLASQQRTAAQIAERVAAERKAAREVIGGDISDEEFERTPDVLVNLYSLAAERREQV
ncbi:hypothetical protein ACFC4C_39530 [Streptomyces sp. NPDC056039]|uniref:hypothetical protein n=1 Tax=Streptomyces sp. NPDC056039 TaxID=3345687 RepID=UPI0035E39C99